MFKTMGSIRTAELPQQALRRVFVQLKSESGYSGFNPSKVENKDNPNRNHDDNHNLRILFDPFCGSGLS